MNTFGQHIRLTTFGESHGPAIGGVLDGFPSGLVVDTESVQRELNRRRPGSSSHVSERQEADQVRFLSGIYDGKTTGAPIAFMVENTDQRPEDYAALANVFRPSHADYTYQMKYGHRDPRGGGRQSARITIPRVVAGALCKQLLAERGITIRAKIYQIGSLHSDDEAEMLALVDAVKAQGDSIGGVVECRIEGCPVGVGEPEFRKLHATLASAMLSIHAARAFEVGSGFEGCTRRGSEENDAFTVRDGQIRTLTNNSGGIQGGISNGEDIIFRVGFKPIATIGQPQQTVAVSDSSSEPGQQTGAAQYSPVTFTATGRHDACAVPRALPIVEAMAALVLADFLV